MKYSTYNKWRLYGFFTVLLCCFSVEAEPWRLKQAAGMPDWFSLSGSHRMRIENLDEQFRGGRTGGDQALLFRTLIRGDLDFGPIKFVAEMIDSRSKLADSGTPLSTSAINPTDLLQAHVEFKADDLFFDGDQNNLRLGRVTINVGDRRLVARNLFRNTLNSFTGADWQWQSKDKQYFRAFYTLPVQRRVDGNILDDNPAFDKQDDEVVFWGLYYAPAKMPWGNEMDKGEFFLFSLDEKDSPSRATLDRDIQTVGFRFYRKAARSQYDYEIESVYQFGSSRASRTATADLDHRAFFQHLELGYTFPITWSPRLIAQFDYASGDDDPADGENNRFNTLFGARRFDFGPTSLFGPFVRANLISPGLRLKVKPTQNTSSFVAFRGYWLASADDAWPVASLRNAVGVNDRYIGSQLEARVRWEAIPGNVRLEAGAAHLIAGDIMDNAGKDNSTYIYSLVSFKF